MNKLSSSPSSPPPPSLWSESMPRSMYMGIALNGGNHENIGVYFYDGFGNGVFYEKHISFNDNSIHVRNSTCEGDFYQSIISYLQQYQEENHCKIIAAGIVDGGDLRLMKLGPQLWFRLNILASVIKVTKGTLDDMACSAARKTVQWFVLSQCGGLLRINTGPNHEVNVDGIFTFAALENYQCFCSAKSWERIEQYARQIREKKMSIVFFNSTAQGGGVAIIRHSIIRFLRLLGIDAHWYILKPNPNVFKITKQKFHNVLQGVASKDTILTEEDKIQWKHWCTSNVKRYWDHVDSPVASATVIVIDDPQPCAMIPYLKKLNPKAKFVYRSHIELRSDLIDDVSTEQSKVWNFLWKNIGLCDVFVSHPVDTFIPCNVRLQQNMKIIKMPASTDPLDGLNKPLDPYSLDYYKRIFNRCALDQVGHVVDFSRPYFIQISRFDPSKGISHLIEAYCKFREASTDALQNIPQLIITGHGSIDDPEGSIIYHEMLEMIKRGDTAKYSSDIFLIRLEPCDQLLNAILRGSMVAFQLSLREGFEVKVSEALMKGRPVIAYAAGGIPLQITDSFDGFLLKIGDIDSVAKAMQDVVFDQELVRKLSQNAQQKPREWVLTPRNALNWMEIMLFESYDAVACNHASDRD